MNRSKQNISHLENRRRKSGAMGNYSMAFHQKNMSKMIDIVNKYNSKDSIIGGSELDFLTTLLTGSRVIDGGKIYPFGIVRVLRIGQMSEENDMSGLEVWSPELIAYGNPEYLAEVIGEKIIVRHKKTGVQVKTVKFSECSTCHVWQCIVSEGGFLNTVGSMMFLFISHTDIKPYSALKKAVKGEDPGYYDNSTFTQVNEKHLGKRVFSFSIEELSNDVFVFDEDGYLIESESDNWLAYDRWGLKTPPPKIWGDLLDDWFEDELFESCI
jgi:hypothetical protein